MMVASGAMSVDPPSNTSSSWPPTRLTYATGAPTEAAHSAMTVARKAALPLSKGEALSLSAVPESAGQMSSQIAMPTRAPSTSITQGAAPGANVRASSNTPDPGRRCLS